jgi:hypothetical protein
VLAHTNPPRDGLTYQTGSDQHDYAARASRRCEPLRHTSTATATAARTR